MGPKRAGFGHISWAGGGVGALEAKRSWIAKVALEFQRPGVNSAHGGARGHGKCGAGFVQLQCFPCGKDAEEVVMGDAIP